jgi:hypothetical protein
MMEAGLDDLAYLNTGVASIVSTNTNKVAIHSTGWCLNEMVAISVCEARGDWS